MKHVLIAAAPNDDHRDSYSEPSEHDAAAKLGREFLRKLIGRNWTLQ